MPNHITSLNVFYTDLVTSYCISSDSTFISMAYKDNRQLQLIQLSHMEIVHIDELAFVGLTTLCNLNLMHAGLLMVPPLSLVKSTLEELHLVHNNISSVPRDYFVGFEKLAVLSLRNNLLYEIPEISSLWSTITNINFDSNRVNYISLGLNWTVYSQLTNVHLGGNAIRIFQSDIMSFLPTLQRFVLHDNNIVHLPASFPNIDCKTAPISAQRHAFSTLVEIPYIVTNRWKVL